MDQRYTLRAAMLLTSLSCLAPIGIARVYATDATNRFTPFHANELEGQPLPLNDALTNLFSSVQCKLPDEIYERIQSKEQSAVPSQLTEKLKIDINTDAQKVSTASVNSALLTIYMQKPNTNSYESIRLRAGDSYNSLNPMSFIDGQSPKVIFTMDCSGLLTAAIAADTAKTWTGSPVSFSAQAAADTSMKATAALVVVDAYVFSPVVLAMNPNLGEKIPVPMQLDLLFAMQTEAVAYLKRQGTTIANDTVISADRETHLIWMSNTGGASFQGEANFSGQAGVGFAVASLNINATAGGNLSREISFTDFYTYTMPDNRQTIKKDGNSSTPDTYPSKFADLHSAMIDLMQHANADPVATQVNNGTTSVATAFSAIPDSICSRAWTATLKSTGNTAGAATATYDPNKGECEFVLNPNGPLAGKTVILTAPTGLETDDNFELFFTVPN